MSDSSPSRAELYLARRERYEAEATQLEKKSRLISNFRGLSFGVSVICLLFAVFSDAGSIVAVAAGVSAVVFFVLVFVHARVIEEEELARRWAYVNQLSQQRVSGQTDLLEETGERFLTPDHPYAGDLDLFGQGSLFQRINAAHTRFGQATLADFLLLAASREEILHRQEAARQLSQRLDDRQRLEAHALGLTRSSHDTPALARAPDPETLLRWAESQPQLEPVSRWQLIAKGLPLLTLLGWAYSMFADASNLFWVLPVTAQVLVNFSIRPGIAQTFAAVTSSEAIFARFGPMLEVLEQLDADTPLIRSLRAQLTNDQPESSDRGEQLSPSEAMKRFAKLVGWFELRLNGVVHPFINALVLWDLNCCLALERWQRQYGGATRRWFEALGELEALSSLAGMAYDHPDHCWPEISDSNMVYQAEGLSHPLIRPEVRVPNDVALDDETKALLVTGSNMSGKSTLLRSMGLAAVMALSGAPVCARRLSISTLNVQTSMRISDSLEQGVSHFYAELKRIKGVLSATAGELPVLFLLDEILHGTNSIERQIGARWIFSQLLQARALGAISTHDSALCEFDAVWMKHVAQVHLRETVENGSMTFDYKLRPGPVRGGNALRLMRSVGLEVPLQS